MVHRTDIFHGKSLGRYYPCSERTFIGSAKDVYIDYGSRHSDVPGTIFRNDMYLSINTYDMEEWEPKPDCDESRLVVYDEIASSLSVYPAAFAHVTVELLPKLVHLLRNLPYEVPILIQRASVIDQYLDVLFDAGLINKERIRWYDLTMKHVIYARKLWFVGESPTCGYRHGDKTGFMWQSREVLQMTRQIFWDTIDRHGDEVEEWVEKWRVNPETIRGTFVNPLQVQLWKLLGDYDGQKFKSGLILLADRPRSEHRRLENPAAIIDHLR